MTRLTEFLRLVWRRDHYYRNGKRWPVRDAWWAAGVISQHATKIRKGR